jgi:hypothetical protein
MDSQGWKRLAYEHERRRDPGHLYIDAPCTPHLRHGDPIKRAQERLTQQMEAGIASVTSQACWPSGEMEERTPSGTCTHARTASGPGWGDIHRSAPPPDDDDDDDDDDAAD